MPTRALLLITIFMPILCLNAISSAQTIELSGRVFNELGNPISGAEVKVDKIPYMGAVTDADGNFILNFEEGDLGREVRIWIDKQGFKIWFRDIKINEDMRPLGLITLEKPLQAPKLKKPKNDTTSYDPYTTFRWEPEEDCSYNLQVDDESNFFQPEINVEDLRASQYESKEKLTDGIYYWRVQLKKETGNYSKWSEPWIVRIRDISPIIRARNRNAAFCSLVIPGWGQKYQGRRGKWWTISYGLSIIGAISAHLIYDKEYDKYLEARSIEELEDAYDLANWSRKIRNGLFIAIPVIAISSAIHAYSSDTRIKEENHAGIEYDLCIRKGQIQLVFTKSF